ncbi:hypothetical protein ACFSJQ_04530 [Vibrio olivae]
MGTSTPNKGPNSNNPLVPTWLEGGGEDTQPQGGGDGDPDIVPQPQIKPETGQRFRNPRSEMNRYFRTGDTGSMKSGVSRYVKNTGGKGSATKRMGSSTKAAGNLLSFLTDVAQRGTEAVAKSLNLTLRPDETVDELLLRVSDQICDVSTSNIPDAVARSAYIETIIEMTSTIGITDLDAITPEQIEASLSCFIGKVSLKELLMILAITLLLKKQIPCSYRKPYVN